MNIMRLLAFLLALALGLSPTAAYANHGKILVLGDSISAGLGVKPELRWVNLFSQEMRKNYQMEVINASLSGETSGGGKLRLPALLQAHHPRYVLIELGGNDGLRGMSTKTMESNLHDMISQSQSAGAKVILIGMRIPSSYGNRYTDAFASVYSSLAKKLSLPLVPFLLDRVALDPTLMQNDKIHPNDRAQVQLLRNVMAIVGPYLHQQRRSQS